METLGLSMKNPVPSNHGPAIFAGYTYFGQFIDHDLTRDDTPLINAGDDEPCDIENHRSPWLDLEILYGDGPCSLSHRDLYAADGASFRLGTDVHTPFGEEFDVPLDAQKEPQLADRRNRENPFIRQIHAMFLKLHNAAVKELPRTLGSRERFERARDRVRWQYQYLVRHDFLRTVCKQEVYQQIMGGTRLVDWGAGGFSIPIEFSQAAFRFGHSMVRDSYILNGLSIGGGIAGTPLETLFDEANQPGPILSHRYVDWDRFLGGVSTTGTEFAEFINTGIPLALFHLRLHDVALFVKSVGFDPGELQLPIRTLQRGAATLLANGEQAESAFGRGDSLRSTYPSANEWAILDNCGLRDNTPLWYYILLEAQLEGGGADLGTVGSRIVAEVIEGCLRSDRNSFLAQNELGWVPPPWTGPQGQPIAVRTLHDAAVVVGLATP
ncbi:MAG TPA: peroxidase family protein [Chthoniobacterales bacterium]|nr:peroxidase family protein [Chthoniobacterales bacterium]